MKAIIPMLVGICRSGSHVHLWLRYTLHNSDRVCLHMSLFPKSYMKVIIPMLVGICRSGSHVHLWLRYTLHNSDRVCLHMSLFPKSYMKAIIPLLRIRLCFISDALFSLLKPSKILYTVSREKIKIPCLFE